MELFKIILFIAAVTIATILALENDTSSTEKPEIQRSELDVVKPSANFKRSISNSRERQHKFNRFEPRSRKNRSRNRKSRQKNKKFSKFGRGRTVLDLDNNTPHLKIENTKPIININFDPVYKESQNDDKNINLPTAKSKSKLFNFNSFKTRRENEKSDFEQEHLEPEQQNQNLGNNNGTSESNQQKRNSGTKKLETKNGTSGIEIKKLEQDFHQPESKNNDSKAFIWGSDSLFKKPDPLQSNVLKAEHYKPIGEPEPIESEPEPKNIESINKKPHGDVQILVPETKAVLNRTESTLNRSDIDAERTATTKSENKSDTLHKIDFNGKNDFNLKKSKEPEIPQSQKSEFDSKQIDWENKNLEDKLNKSESDETNKHKVQNEKSQIFVVKTKPNRKQENDLEDKNKPISTERLTITELESKTFKPDQISAFEKPGIINTNTERSTFTDQTTEKPIPEHKISDSNDTKSKVKFKKSIIENKSNGTNPVKSDLESLVPDSEIKTSEPQYIKVGIKDKSKPKVKKLLPTEQKEITPDSKKRRLTITEFESRNLKPDQISASEEPGPINTNDERSTSADQTRETPIPEHKISDSNDTKSKVKFKKSIIENKSNVTDSAQSDLESILSDLGFKTSEPQYIEVGIKDKSKPEVKKLLPTEQKEIIPDSKKRRLTITEFESKTLKPDQISASEEPGPINTNDERSTSTDQTTEKPIPEHKISDSNDTKSNVKFKKSIIENKSNVTDFAKSDLESILSDLGFKTSDPQYIKVGIKDKSKPEVNKCLATEQNGITPDSRKSISLDHKTLQQNNIKNKETRSIQVESEPTSPNPKPGFFKPNIAIAALPKKTKYEKPTHSTTEYQRKTQSGQKLVIINSEKKAVTQIQKVVPTRKDLKILELKHSRPDRQHKVVGVRSSKYKPDIKRIEGERKNLNPAINHTTAQSRPTPKEYKPKSDVVIKPRKPIPKLANPILSPKKIGLDHKTTLELRNSKHVNTKIEPRRELRQSKDGYKEPKPEILVPDPKPKQTQPKSRVNDPDYRKIVPDAQNKKSNPGEPKHRISELENKGLEARQTKSQVAHSAPNYNKNDSQNKRVRKYGEPEFDSDERESEFDARKSRTEYQGSKIGNKDRRRTDNKLRSLEQESRPYEPRYKELKPGYRKVLREYERPKPDLKQLETKFKRRPDHIHVPESEYKKVRPKYERLRPETRTEGDRSAYRFRKREHNDKDYSEINKEDSRSKYKNDKNSKGPEYDESKIELNISGAEGRNSDIEFKKPESLDLSLRKLEHEARRYTTEKIELEIRTTLPELATAEAASNEEEATTQKQNIFFKVIKDWW